MTTVPPEELGLACWGCGEPRITTERTHGVWTTCDYCGSDWWCIGVERDWMDEPTAFACSGGCNDGWECSCGDDADDWRDEWES